VLRLRLSVAEEFLCTLIIHCNNLEDQIVLIRTMMEYVLLNAGLHSFLNSAADGSERSGLRPSCLT
jgi:hypothetical protein